MREGVLHWTKQARGIEPTQQAGSSKTLRLRAMLPHDYTGQFNSL